MNRRDFLKTAGALSATLALPGSKRLFAEGVPTGDWRTFEVTTRVEVLKPSGPTLIWVPAALIGETPYQKTLANDFKAEGGEAKMVEGPSKADRLGIVAAKYPAGAQPVLTVTSRVSTRNVAVDLSRPGNGSEGGPRPARALPPADEVRSVGRHREGDGGRGHEGRENGRREGPRDLRVDRRQHVPQPQDARLRRRRHPVHARVEGPRRQVRRLERPLRGLARASGLPARDVYGIRVAEVGARIQEPRRLVREGHEVAALPRRGVPRRPRLGPVDPADVRKVVLEEPPETARSTTTW